MSLLILICVCSLAYGGQKRVRHTLRGITVHPMTNAQLAKLLGEGGINEEYMKIQETEHFSGKFQRDDSACEMYEETVDDPHYFPRYTKHVFCKSEGKRGCNPDDSSYECVQTYIMKNRLTKDDFWVYHDGANGDYYDFWEQTVKPVMVGCECSRRA